MEWTEISDCLCIKAKWAGTTFVLPPFSTNQLAIGRALDILLAMFRTIGKPFMIQGVEKFMLTILEGIKPGFFKFVPDRNNFDYVYNAEDLATLAGRKYHAKKNHVNKFKNTYQDYRYLPLTSELTGMCIDNAVEWCKKHGCQQGDGLDMEKKAIIEALNSFDFLDLAGGAIMVEGKLEAFTFGERLNSDTVVVHVEKANPNIPGMYAVINQEFSSRYWPQFRYINREEDLGIPGLRKAKLSYHPEILLEKYIVTVNEPDNQ